MARKKPTQATGQKYRICIIVSQFNEFITARLLKGCLKELSQINVRKENISIVYVPGAFELPVAALKYARKKSQSAVICLGAVIRGETIHFDLVAKAAAQGIMEAALMTGKPVIFGVITTDTIDQAYKRSGDKGDNKGKSAARAAVHMIEVLRKK